MVKYLDSFLMAKGEQHFHLLIMDMKMLEMESTEAITTFKATLQPSITSGTTSSTLEWGWEYDQPLCEMGMRTS